MENYNENKLIGKRIKEARIRNNFTQYRLHELTGISITQISAYENGNRNIGLCSLKKIADATRTTIDELYSGNGEEKPITSSQNEGKLIINCITALFEKNVISILNKTPNDYVQNGLEYYYQIGFCNYVNILDDFIKKLVDFKENESNYPNPEEFKKQLIEAAANKINNIILSNK